MHKIQITKLVNKNLNFIYDLVMNVESYNEFLPWCKSVKLVSRNKDEKQFIADAVVSYMGINEGYRSLITVEKYDKKIKIFIKAIDGPFKFLHSTWTLDAIDQDNTNVDFEIKFEFNNFVMNKLASVFTQKAKEKIISAFERKLFSN